MDNTERKLGEVVDRVEGLINAISFVYGTDLGQIREWQKVVSAVRDYMTENITRIAVVGAVKSGKSTFINALLGGDYLKRGAGIITAFVTKIRHDQSPQVKIDFKTWDEITYELNDALTFFPIPELFGGKRPFNIRNGEDRGVLQEGLERLKSHDILSDEGIDKNFILLNSYLEGYEKLNSYIGDAPRSIILKGNELKRHKDFVSQQSQAVFLRDILLHIPLELIGEGIEIGDCQGIDSPNPSHFAMVQDYLLKSHFILHVISSRMGLRQADIDLLSAIKRLRLLENTIFIINADFSEHEHLQDLLDLVQRVHQELSLIKPEPEVYTFSCLHNLLDQLYRHEKNSVSKKDLVRMQAWEEDEDMVDFSKSETKMFQDAMTKCATEKKSALLLSSATGLITTVNHSMQEFIKVNQGVWNKDWEVIKGICENINEKKKNLDSVVTIIEDTAQGHSENIKKKVRSQVDGYFDRKYGPIVSETMKLINDYPLNLDEFEKKSAHLEDQRTWREIYILYTFCQRFRQSLDKFLIGEINLKTISFVKTQQEPVEREFADIYKPFSGMIEDSLQGYYSEVKKLGIDLSVPSLAAEGFTYRRPELNIPIFSRVRHGDSRIGTQILLRFGFRKINRSLKKIITKNRDEDKGPDMKFVKDSLRVIKSETKKELLDMFSEYAENVKFLYFFKLIDHIAHCVVEDLKRKMNMLVVDLSRLVEVVERKKIEKEENAKNLSVLYQQVQMLTQDFEKLKNDMAISSCPE